MAKRQIRLERNNNQNRICSWRIYFWSWTGIVLYSLARKNVLEIKKPTIYTSVRN